MTIRWPKFDFLSFDEQGGEEEVQRLVRHMWQSRHGNRARSFLHWLALCNPRTIRWP